MGRFWTVLALVLLAALAWRALAGVRARRRRPEQALILTLRLGDRDTPPELLHARLREVDAALRSALADRRAGELEDPFARGVDCVYTCYGPDADRLWDAARMALEGVRLLPGSRAVRRFGGPGAPEEPVEL